MINTLNFNFENTLYTISNFRFNVSNCKTKPNLIEVLCIYKCNEMDINLPIYYPNDFCKSNEEYIEKATNFIKILINNKELLKYTLKKVKNQNYTINIDKNANFIGYVDLDMFDDDFYKNYNNSRQQNGVNQINNTNKNTPSNNKDNNKKTEKDPNKPSKGLKFWFGFALTTLIISLGVIGFGGYKFLISGVSSLVNITFDFGDGYYIEEDGKTTKYIKITAKKGCDWPEVVKSGNIPDTTKIQCNEYYQFESWMTLDGNQVSDQHPFPSDETLVAGYKIKDPTGDFETDSFLTLSTFHNFDKLKETYKTDTFIGLTKTIDILGVPYTVRVIGENGHDSCIINESSGEEKKCLLTFEFTNLFTDSVQFSSTTNNEYSKNNDLSKYLNNAFINFLPTDLKESLLHTKKSVINYPVSTDPESTIIYEYLFLPSAIELGFEKFPDNEYIKKAYLEETYLYYKDGTKTKVKQFPGETQSSPSYYIRTPYQNNNTQSLIVNSAGELALVEPTSYNYFSPCFCIGMIID